MRGKDASPLREYGGGIADCETQLKGEEREKLEYG